MVLCNHQALTSHFTESTLCPVNQSVESALKARVLLSEQAVLCARVETAGGGRKPDNPEEPELRIRPVSVS